MSAGLLTRIWAQPGHRPEFTLPEWEIVLGQARQARLLARLAQHFAERDWLSQVPSQPRQYLEGALRLSDRQHHEVQWEVDCICRALKEVDTPVILLKGAAYLIAALPPGRSRLFSDIDIMVKHASLHDVESELFSHGWISEERDAYNDMYYRKWMHEIPQMKHVQRNTVIDVHHTITPPTSRFKVDQRKLFGRIVMVDDERKLFVLAPADMLLHSAVHLFQEGEFSHGLRDLLDISDLLQHFGQDADFWPELFMRAKELGLGEPLYHALHQTQRLFAAGVPARFHRELQSIKPNVLVRWTLSALLKSALQPQHPSCNTRFNDFARWLLFVRSHYLRMPWYLLIPHLTRKAYMRSFP